jgi:hypothetical protein
VTLIDILIPVLILAGAIGLAKSKGNVVAFSWVVAACLGLSQCEGFTH